MVPSPAWPRWGRFLILLLLLKISFPYFPCMSLTFFPLYHWLSSLRPKMNVFIYLYYIFEVRHEFCSLWNHPAFTCVTVLVWGVLLWSLGRVLLFSLAPVSELRCAILCFGYFFWFYLGICLFHSYSWDHSGAANTLLLGEASTSCSQLELGQFSSLLWIIQAFPLSFSMDDGRLFCLRWLFSMGSNAGSF